MSAIIGTVARVAGEFSIQRADGTINEVIKNIEIYEGDTVRGSQDTSEFNSLVVNMVDGVDIVMIGDDSQLFDASLLQEGFAENETVTDIESIEAIVDDVDFTEDIQDDVDDIDTEAGDEEVISSSTDTKMNDFTQNNEEIQDINAELKDVDKEEKQSPLNNDYQENRENSVFNEAAIDSEISDIVSNISDLIDAANVAALTANSATNIVNAAAQAADNNPSVENLEATERAQITANTASIEAANAASVLENAISNLNAVAARVGREVDTTEAVRAVENANEASVTAMNAATTSEIVTDNEIADMVLNLTDLTNSANTAAQNANALADEANEAVRLANENPTLENLNRAQDAQEAASQAANSSVNAATALENGLSQLEESADAANEEIDTQLITSANNAIDSADNSADNANQSANENLHVSTILDSDASDNSINENVADGTYTGVTLNAVDVDGEEVTYNITDDVPFRVEADGRVVVDGESAIDYETDESYTFDVTATSRDGTVSTQSVTIDVNNINEAPQIEDTQTISMTEDSLDGFTGYGSTWSGDIYSIVTQAEMLSHLNILDVDSNDFTVTLANHDDGSSYHHGLQALDSTFSNTTSNRYDEQVIQVTQEFLDTYPQIDAQVGDFYFDNVEFDKLGEGESASVSFSVVVNDGELTSEAHTVNIEVVGSNDSPMITITDTTLTEDIAQVIANVSDIDGIIDSSTLTAENGTVTIADNGNITYTPNANFNGNDSVTISVTDDAGATTTQTFNVSVAAVNDGPIALNDAFPEPVFSQVYDNEIDGSKSFDSHTNGDESVFTQPFDTQLTMSAWIKMDGNVDSFARVVEMGESEGTYYKDSSAITFGATGNSLGDKNTIRAWTNEEGSESGRTPEVNFDMSAYVGDGQMHLVTYTFDNSFAKLYVDGQEVDSVTITNPISSIDNPETINIGGYDGTSSYSFEGDIDGIGVFNEALTPAQVQAVFEAGTGSVVASLVTDEDSAITIDVLANDTDIDGDVLSITEIQGQDVTNNGEPVNVTDADGNILGTAKIVDNQIEFNPNGTLQDLYTGENQEVVFEYTISDGSMSSTANVTINVEGLNDNDITTTVSKNSIFTLNDNDETTFDAVVADVDNMGLTDAFTVSLDARLDEGDDWSTLIEKVAPDGKNDFIIAFDQGKLMIELNDDDVYEGGNDAQKFIIGDTADYVGEMHTYTMSYDSSSNGTINFYIDGNLESTFDNVGNFTSADEGKLIIGGDIDNNYPTVDSDPFTGVIDNVQVYNTAISSEEAIELSDGDVLDNGLVVHYDFNGENPFDNKAGDNYNASPTGGAEVQETTTLVSIGDGDIDFSALDSTINEINTVDLSQGSQNITNIHLEDVLSITDDNNILRIDGDESDHVILNSEWTLGDFKTDAETGQEYQEVIGEVDGQDITLEISTDVTIDES